MKYRTRCEATCRPCASLKSSCRDCGRGPATSSAKQGNRRHGAGFAGQPEVWENRSPRTGGADEMDADSGEIADVVNVRVIESGVRRKCKISAHWGN